MQAAKLLEARLRACRAPPICARPCSRRSAWTPRSGSPRPTRARTARVWQPGRYGEDELFNSRALPRATRRRRAAASRRARAYGAFLSCLLARGAAAGGALLAPETVDEMLAPQFGPLPGGVDGVGEWPDLCWGLGFDVRGHREPHWAGTALSPRAASHFGASGTLAWLDPERGLGLVALANRGTLQRLVARAVGRARRRGDRRRRSGVDPPMKRIRTRPGAGPEAFDAARRGAPRRRPPLSRLPHGRPRARRGSHRRRVRARLEASAIASIRGAQARAAGCSRSLARARSTTCAPSAGAAPASGSPPSASRGRAAEDAAGLCDGYSAALETGLARLSAADREVIALRVLLELDAGEAARLLEITPTACTTRLSRALARLAAEVESHEHV